MSEATKNPDAEMAWQIMVSLVMDTRRNWRRKVDEATGMPFSRMRALWRLAEEARTLSELAQELGTDAPAATVIVNDLERRHLVSRRPHPENARAKLVSLTKAGERLVAMVEQIDDRPPAAMSALPAAQLERLRSMLERVAERT